MSFKKTVIVSVFFHFFFFTAALLLSANLFGGSSRIHNEKIFFVKLTEDTGRAGIEKLVIKVKGPATKKSVQTTVEVRSVKKNEFTTKNGSVNGILSASYKLDNKESAIKTEKPENENVGESAAEDEPAINIQDQDVSVEDSVTSEDRNDLNLEEDVNSILLSGHKNGGAKVIMESVMDDENSSIGAGGLYPMLIETIRRSIERARTYPILARKRGMEGIVHISFKISPQGKPLDIKILKSSGYRILDNTTLNIVKKAAPFPQLDSPIEVPVVFRLNN